MRHPERLILLAVALWIAALFLPALYAGDEQSFRGIDVLMDGYQAGRFGVYAWYANPLMLCALIAGWLRWYRSAGAIAALALLLAMSSFAAQQIARSNGAPVPELQLAIGFYLWIAACSLIFAASLQRLRLALHRTKDSP